MAYDPADLRLPPWLLRFLDLLIRLRLPLVPGWRIGLTRAGAIFVAVVFGVWAAAFYSGNNLLYLCGSMLAVMMAASVRAGMAAIAQTPVPDDWPLLECGRVHALRRRLPGRPGLPAVTALAWKHPDLCDGMSVRADGEAFLLRGRLRARRRGLFCFDTIELAGEGPAGLFFLQQRRAVACEIAALPAEVPWPMQAGSHRAEGDEWRDLRAYVPGDAPSRIHWRKAAWPMGAGRTDWVVKRFGSASESREEACLRVDLRLPSGRTRRDFERLLGRAWFWLRQRQGRPGRLILGDREFDTMDRASWHRAARALAACEPSARPPASGAGMLLTLERGA